jgi:surfactin synthase thioesterase subunit
MTDTRSEADRWLRRFTPAADARSRLICFPHAGGAATFYGPLARALPGSVEVLALQYPGRQDRLAEPGVDDAVELAERIFGLVRDRTDLPLVLFGHSMGAVLAFEVARRLERAPGVPLRGLVVSGRYAPSVVRHENVHTGGDAALVAEITKLNGTDARLLQDEDVREMILPSLRSDYKAVETYRYRPGPPLDCPVTVFTGDSDPRVSIAEARAWQNHTTGPFRLLTFAGGHFYLAERPAPVIAALADQVAAFAPAGAAGR